MPQKNKKPKKKDVGKRKQNNEAEKSEKSKTFGKGLNLKGAENLAEHFNNDELQEIKNVVKSKDMSNVPLVLAAVILNKFNVLKDFVENGCNVNETGPNHVTALIWAVKCMNIKVINFLLVNGADPTIKNDNGDNVLFLALENKLWKEQDYITLWNHIKSVSFVDVDFTSKNGRNMVHMVIRREWSDMLDILIAEKANVNTENANGMTPLMLASYLNNFSMVSALLEAKADVLKEDASGSTALCYAISYVINKNPQSTLLVVDKLMIAFRNHEITFQDFFKSRIDGILNYTVKQVKSRQPVLEAKTYLIHYTLRFTKSGLRTILNEDILARITHVVSEKYSQDPFQMMKYLTIINEIMKYCEFYCGNCAIKEKLLESFVLDGVADMCLNVLKMYGSDNTYDYDFISAAFAPLVTASLHEEGTSWLCNNFSDVLLFYKKFLIRNPIVKDSDDIQTLRNNEKMTKFNELVDTIKEEIEFLETGHAETEELNETQDPQNLKEAQKSDYSVKELKSNPKKTKRRAKALKAKIAKIKSADLTERLNKNGKKILEQKCVSDTSIIKNAVAIISPESCEQANGRSKPFSKYSSWEQIWLVDNTSAPLAQEFTDLVNIFGNQLVSEDVTDDFFNIDFEMKMELEREMHRQLEIKGNRRTYEVVSLYPDWKNKSLTTPDEGDTASKSEKKKKRPRSFEYTKQSIEKTLKEKPSEEQIKDLLTYTLNYLSGLLKKIIITYEKHWEQDKKKEELFKNDHGDDTNQNEKTTNTACAMEKLETEHIQRVQKQFDKLIKHIKYYADKNFQVCSKIIDQLEAILLNHKIRGRTIIHDTVMQVVNIEEDFDQIMNNFCDTEPDIPVPPYVENLLSNSLSGNLDDDEITININPSMENFDSTVPQHPDALYLQEILALPPKAPPDLERHKRNKIRTMKNAYHLVPSIMSMCDESDNASGARKREDLAKRESPSTSKYRKRQTLQETLLAMPKIDDPNKLLEALEDNLSSSDCQSLMENSTTRWCSTIRTLQMMDNYQILLNGEIRISSDEKDDLHTISSGGNFSPVLLGLDVNDRPLAVKRIKKDNCVCKIMKNLINPLLGLRNTNLLHYFSCNYEENELILATPLCEYNMGEYIMIMKQSPNMYIKPIDIVKQFLAGLRFLHDRGDPIVHGNLKPSNIFIDLNGIVRIAEFGMHKALYTLTEAPNTSIIWFSRETFAAFKELSNIMCTCASDIQVAGMLIHFMLTAGKHPYGETMQEILKNLERAVPQLATSDVDLHDLISWMLLYEPSERPLINQVLSHVFFWTIERKWRFILTCSGVSSHGTPLNVPLDELHVYINIVAARENIKGRWISVTKRKFPNLTYTKEDQDSITGLLRFIRNCMQNQAALHINSDFEFRNFILTSFPALPLSLYRILECSHWLNHRVLQPFTTVDSLSA